MHVYKVGVILVVCAVVTSSAPASTVTSATTVSKHVAGSEKETGRIFWNAFAEVLEVVPFLPITINVPDVVTSVWGFFQGFLPGSEGANNPRDPEVTTTTLAPTKTNKTQTNLKYRVNFDDMVDYMLFDD